MIGADSEAVQPFSLNIKETSTGAALSGTENPAAVRPCDVSTNTRYLCVAMSIISFCVALGSAAIVDRHRDFPGHLFHRPDRRQSRGAALVEDSDSTAEPQEHIGNIRG